MWSHFPHFLLRTPLLSLNKINDTTYDHIPALFEEGVYLSSPDYWAELNKAEQQSPAEKDRLDKTFLKYWLRSCTRSTPYGTFAGSMLGTISNGETRIILKEHTQHIRKIRLDMNYIAVIIQALVQIPVIQDQLKLFPNNSSYELPYDIRFAEYYIANNIRYYHLTAIPKTDYVRSVLALAGRGATIDELSAMLILSEGVEREEAVAFIREMLQSQLLVSELEPCVTGKEPLDHLIQQLNDFEHVEPVLIRLKKIQELINKPEQGVGYYKKIEKEIQDLGISVAIPKNTLQTDLHLSAADCTINGGIIADITAQTGDLVFLSRRNKNKDLETFRTKYQLKYEEAEMPLSIVLDADHGIGYGAGQEEAAGGSNLIDDLVVAGAPDKERNEFDYIQNYTFYKYNDFVKTDKPFIELKTEELISFKNQVRHFHFPDSMYIMGQLILQHNTADPNDFIFDLAALGGPSAGNLFGRFTHGDQQLLDFTRGILNKEAAAQPDIIYAEVVHMPQARVGNILLRPVLRTFEIPYIGISGAAAENQIPLSDLYVSVCNDEVILRSKKLNKRIIPRLTTAHNYTSNSLPVYKFLCDLQTQHLAHPGIWDWGRLSNQPYLPRVVYRNLILKKARWKIEAKDIRDLPADKTAYCTYFKTLSATLKLPRRVLYTEGDNELLIDFEDSRSVELLLEFIKKYKMVFVQEFLFNEDNCIVSDVTGAPYINELIIPVAKTAVSSKATIPAAYYEHVVQRKFAPFSEWLYFKVYCGAKAAEQVLKATVLPFVTEGLETGLFEKFFFVRYKDDFSHFRIRFFNSDIRKQLKVQQLFFEALQRLLDNETIGKVQIDTYSRELERYDPRIIAETETLFFNDSLAILKFIDLLEGGESEKYRMVFAMKGIDALLNDFQIPPAEKQGLLKVIQSSYFNEFGAHPILQKQLNAKYRDEQKSIFSFMNSLEDADNEIEEGADIFKQRSEMNAPVIAEIYAKFNGDLEKGLLSDILYSHIHMFINRLFIAQQRKYELIIYHFLEKYYASRLAIAKSKVK